MSTTYNYARAVYFIDGIIPGQLYLEIENNSSITKTLNKVTDDGSADIQIIFDTALTTGEKTTLDGIVSAYKLTVSTDKMEIQEESIPTGGNFKCETKVISTNASSTSTNDYSWKIPISVLAIYFVTTTDHEGDTMTMSVAPDTITGAITSDIAIGDTVISVQQTVIDNAALGFKVALYNGQNTDDCGQILVIDKVNKTITVETAATQIFLAATPTYIQQTVSYVENYEFGPPWEYVIGESKIGGSYVPAGKIIRVQYTNNSAFVKKLVAKIEYLY